MKSKIPIIAIKRTMSIGIDVTRFCYVIDNPEPSDKWPYWIADLEEDDFTHPQSFKWEDDPCGESANREDVKHLFESGVVVGFIDENKKLRKTRKVAVERAWSDFGFGLIPTKKELI